MRARTLATFALLVPVLACGRQLDTAGLEEQLLEVIDDQGGPEITEVTCPEVEAETGATFTCEATGAGTTWTIEVTQVDDDGEVEWRIVGTAQGS
jgi:Domain of unknown function (DUF4333)